MSQFKVHTLESAPEASRPTLEAIRKAYAETVAALREAKPLPDRKLQALRTFALEAVRKRGWLDATDVEAFLAAGYDRGHLLEVLTWVSLKTLSNYTNHVAKTPLDAAFSRQKWSKAGKAA